jgi:stalled ribosome rescue protein Dom34
LTASNVLIYNINIPNTDISPKPKTQKQHPIIAPLHTNKVKPVKPKRKYKRGYPVAILTGIEETQATLWKIYSNVAKHEKTISLNGNRNDSKALYNFHEAVINALRPTLKEGVRSIIAAAPARTNYTQALITHIREHHTWLTQGSNKAAISEVTGSASTPAQVAALTRTPTFRQLISETTEEETENLIDLLEKRLNTASQNSAVLFSLEEAENLILQPLNPSKPQPEYLLLTDKYLEGSRHKNRVHRLMQIAANKHVKTRIVNAESPAGKRLTQLGGIVCLA